MTKLGEISKSLYDQCNSIKRHLNDIESKKRSMESSEYYAARYYNYYARSRYSSSRRYYYNYYRRYSSEASNHRSDWYRMISAGRAMVAGFAKSMERFKKMAKGRDDSIIVLKRNVAEQEVIVTQAIAAKAANAQNVIITYARSNFALLGGIIKAVTDAAPKDEAKLLGALRNINDQALAHTDRMTAVADSAIRQISEEKVRSDDRNTFQKNSALSSMSNVANDKIDVLMDGLSGKSDNIAETGSVYFLAGYALSIFYDKTIGGLFAKKKAKQESIEAK